MHTISSAVLNKFLYTRVKLDVSRAFAPISQIGTAAQLLAINAKVPAQNLREFIALLKANPGKYHYGSSGLGAHHASEQRAVWFHGRNRGGSCPLSRRRAGDGGPLAGRIHFDGGQRSRASVAYPLRRTARFVCERRSSPGVAARRADCCRGGPAGLPDLQLARLVRPAGHTGADRQTPQRGADQKPWPRPRRASSSRRSGSSSYVSNPSSLSSELKQQADFWGPLIERIGVKLD